MSLVNLIRASNYNEKGFYKILIDCQRYSSRNRPKDVFVSAMDAFKITNEYQFEHLVSFTAKSNGPILYK